MTTPSPNREATPSGAPSSDSKPARQQRWAAKVLVQPDSGATAPAPVAANARPSGETGGHTVQDWEQPQVNPWLGAAQRHVAASAAAAQPMAPSSQMVGPLGDEASPVAVPLYLRPPSHVLPEFDGAVPPLDVQAPPFDAKLVTLTAQSAALADAITRHLAETFTAVFRPAVSAAIADLLPMILSFGSIPDPDPVPAKAAASAPPLAEDSEGVDGEG